MQKSIRNKSALQADSYRPLQWLPLDVSTRGSIWGVCLEGRGSVITGRNEVVAKVIFLHLSVILFTGGVSTSVHAGIPHPPRSRHTPQSRHPPRADTPPLRKQTPPWEQTPPPGSRHTPPEQTPPRKQTPGYGQ